MPYLSEKTSWKAKVSFVRIFLALCAACGLVVDWFWFCCSGSFPLQRHRTETIAGTTEDDGFLQIILVGACAFAGCFVFGLIVEFLPVPKILAQCILLAVLSLASGLNTVATTQLSVQIYVSLFAFLAIGSAAIVAPAVLEIVRKDQLPHANGQLIMLCSISLISGPPVTGMLLEQLSLSVNVAPQIHSGDLWKFPFAINSLSTKANYSEEAASCSGFCPPPPTLSFCIFLANVGYCDVFWSVTSVIGLECFSSYENAMQLYLSVVLVHTRSKKSSQSFVYSALVVTLGIEAGKTLGP